MRISICVFLIFLSCSCSFAQSDSARSWYLGAGYFSEGGLYPGFTLNAERSLLGNRNFQLVIGGKAGAYFHYRNHTGIFLMVQSGQRFRLYKNLYFEHFLGVGYLHSFLNGGDAYYVDATGTVHKATDKGNPHFMPSISAGLGYDLKRKNNIRLFGRPMIFWQIPFNRRSLLQAGVEVGVTVKFIYEKE